MKDESHKRNCECEHHSHFDNGGAHDYAHRFNPSELASCETTYGQFNICKNCLKDHFGGTVEKDDAPLPLDFRTAG